MKTIIAVPDFTRNAHIKKIIPSLLVNLEKDGISRHDIEIIIATGLHRPPTRSEIKNHFYDTIDRIKIIPHNYRDVSYLGRSKMGIPIYLNKRLKTAKRIITVGVVEPHLYAGYSGGVKVISIGLAGEKTINATHNPKFLDNPQVCISSIKNNPFQDFLWEVADILPVYYSINIINNIYGNLSKLFKGPPRPCFEEAVNYSRHRFEKMVYSYLDGVICDIPPEKSRNIYQASRIFNYITNVKNPVIRKNSIILIKANLEEGFGRGIVEKRFMKALVNMKDPKDTIRTFKRKGCLAGEHRAYMIAHALLKANLGFISRNSRRYNKLPFLFFKNLEEAYTFIKSHLSRKPKVIYIKNPFLTILRKISPKNPL